MIDKSYNEIGFKTDLAYSKVDKMDYLMTLIWSRSINRLSSQTKFLNRPTMVFTNVLGKQAQVLSLLLAGSN